MSGGIGLAVSEGVRVARAAQSRSANQVPAAVELIEFNGDARIRRNRLLQDEHRFVRFADGGVDAPGCLGLAVDGTGNVPASLVEVGDRRGNGNGGVAGVHSHFGEVQVAVVLPARPHVWQRRIGEHFKLDRGYGFGVRGRECVRVLIGPRADEADRAVCRRLDFRCLGRRRGSQHLPVRDARSSDFFPGCNRDSGGYNIDSARKQIRLLCQQTRGAAFATAGSGSYARFARSTPAKTACRP